MPIAMPASIEAVSGHSEYAPQSTTIRALSACTTPSSSKPTSTSW
jgi:hypothetical protein